MQTECAVAWRSKTFHILCLPLLKLVYSRNGTEMFVAFACLSGAVQIPLCNWTCAGLNLVLVVLECSFMYGTCR